MLLLLQLSPWEWPLSFICLYFLWLIRYAIGATVVFGSLIEICQLCLWTLSVLLVIMPHAAYIYTMDGFMLASWLVLVILFLLVMKAIYKTFAIYPSYGAQTNRFTTYRP